MSELIPISAGGGIIFRSADNTNDPEIITIYRRGKWDLPKGKLEDDESIQECAVREVCEEIGLINPPKIVSYLSETVHEYEREDTCYQKYTYWFCMELHPRADEEFIPQQIEGIEKVEWMNIKKARELAGYQNIINLLNNFQKWWAS